MHGELKWFEFHFILINVSHNLWYTTEHFLFDIHGWGKHTKVNPPHDTTHLFCLIYSVYEYLTPQRWIRLKSYVVEVEFTLWANYMKPLRMPLWSHVLARCESPQRTFLVFKKQTQQQCEEEQKEVNFALRSLHLICVLVWLIQQNVINNHEVMIRLNDDVF